MSDVFRPKHPLQAVVLADSFTRTFRPMTLEQPKVLLPVAGTPMIEYSLEMLANAKVREIIVVCCWHADKVEAYLKNSRWSKSKNPVVRVVSFPGASSGGDALRELAQTGQVVSDPFVLMSGDVVSNARLIPIIKMHEENPDSNKVMTSLFQRVDNALHARNFDDDLIIVMDAQSKQLLMYETECEGEVDEENHSEHSIAVSAAGATHPKIEMRSDLRDCHIDICSPVCLDRIQDECYTDLRLDFLRKEIKQGAELGHNFYCHELVEDYAMRVHTLRDYDQVSRDVLNRWVYPLVPDNNWNDAVSGTCWFTHSTWLYRESGVLVDRSAVIGRRTMLGRNSKIGPNVHISNSVLGQNVVVKEGAIIKDSYVWDGAVIEAGVQMDRALVCHDAVIGERARLERGSVVSFKAHIQPDTIVPRFARMTISKPFKEDDGYGREESEDEGEGKAYELREFTIEEEPVFDVPKLPQWISKALNLPPGKSPYTMMGSMGCDELELHKRTWDDLQVDAGGRPSSSSISAAGGGAGGRAMGEESLPLIVAQLVHNLVSKASLRAGAKAAPLLPDDYYSSVAMELKGLRASRLSCTFEEIAAVTFAIILQDGLSSDFKPLTMEETKARLVSIIRQASPLLRKFSQDIVNMQTSIQVALIQAAELVFLFGPTQSFVPELVLELPHAEYLLEECENLMGRPDYVKQVLNEAKATRSLFTVCVMLLGDEENDVIDADALEAWRDAREEMDPELDFLQLYHSQKDKVNRILAVWQESESEEDSSSSEEEDEESEEEESEESE